MPESGNRGLWNGLRLETRRVATYGTIGAYALAAPFGCVGVAALGYLWRNDVDGRARRMQRLTVGAYRILHTWLRITRIVDFDYRSALPDLPSGPCVVVANHPTLLDVTAISATVGRGFTIVKPELHARRLLRPFIVGAGHVVGAGSDPASTKRVIEEAVERVHSGSPLIVFPEGTRSPPGGLRPFGRTAFEIACRARVPVVSVGVVCRPLYLSKEVPFSKLPTSTPRLALRLMAVDDPADCGFDSRMLLQCVESRYRTEQTEHRLAGLPSGR